MLSWRLRYEVGRGRWHRWWWGWYHRPRGRMTRRGCWVQWRTRQQVESHGSGIQTHLELVALEQTCCILIWDEKRKHFNIAPGSTWYQNYSHQKSFPVSCCTWLRSTFCAPSGEWWLGTFFETLARSVSTPTNPNASLLLQPMINLIEKFEQMESFS